MTDEPQGKSYEDQVRTMVWKAKTLGGSEVASQRSAPTEGNKGISDLFKSGGILERPYDPSTLIRISENSSSLPQNVEAYVTNIDGLGHMLKHRFDLDSDETYELVRETLWRQRIREAETAARAVNGNTAPEVDIEALYPNDGEVKIRIEKLKRQARLQKARIKSFFDTVNPDGSFVKLRRLMRNDLEITGNAYWEVLRNGNGEISRFVYVSPVQMYLTKVDQSPTIVTEKVQASPFGYESVEQYRFFRRFVQSGQHGHTWFKQFGDPRIVSTLTGKIFPDMDAFKEHLKSNPKDRPASEIIHFKIHHTGEAYGVPRWIGVLLSVLGSRAADEVNFGYFDNKAVPPLAILVSGGRLAEESVTRIETFLRDNIRGRENFHKILVIEADDDGDPLGNAERPTIKFEKLNDVQAGDALFQKYDERNIDKVGSAFRLPRLMRGDIRDFNRATAQAALKFADEQVFQPERNEFDAWIDREILTALDATLWSFVSLGPKTRDPETMSSITKEGLEGHAIMPNEARAIYAELLGVDLERIHYGWAKQPIALTLAGFQPDDSELEGAAVEVARLREQLSRLLGSIPDPDPRQALVDAQDALAAARQNQDPEQE